MISVAILRRRLKEGKTYDDFRRAWYHTVGFGATNKMLTILNGTDLREIIVIGLTEITMDNARDLMTIESKERKENPLDDVIESEIDRTFGILIAEDDFSGAGPITYKPASVSGKETDMAEVAKNVEEGRKLLAEFQGRGS